MLRRLGIFLIVFVPLFLCVACDDKSDIEKVAYNYCMETSRYNFEEAEQYCTDETKETTLLLAKELMSMVDTGYIAKDSPAFVEILLTDKLSDTSAVAVYHKKTPIKDFVDTIALRKRDGSWLVHAPIKNNVDTQ